MRIAKDSFRGSGTCGKICSNANGECSAVTPIIVLLSVLVLLTTLPLLHHGSQYEKRSAETKAVHDVSSGGSEHMVHHFLDAEWTADSWGEEPSAVAAATPPQQAAPAPGQPLQITVFDKAVVSAYAEANQIPNPPPPRVPFNLQTWRKQTNGGLSNEDRVLLGKTYLEANSVFEFGIGESTYIAAAVGVPRFVGVDSDPVWVTKARDNSGLSNYRFYLADIGQTRDWGYPLKALNKNVFHYQIAALNSEMQAFDMYYVDGRYRIACAAASFLHALSRGGDRNKVKVGTHDNDSRNYHVSLSTIANLVENTPRLYVYRLKPETTAEDVFKLWEQMKHTIM